MSTWDGPSRTKADGNLKGLHNRKHIFWSVITAITILAGPSLAAMFGKKKKSDPPRSDVLVPLYVYPAPGAWEPLFTAYATIYPISHNLTTLTPSTISISSDTTLG